jgi:mannosyltransferase OCH1-like enzyme
MANERPGIDHMMLTSIPVQIWQTLKSHEGAPEAGVALVQTWSEKNPACDHFVLDDTEMDSFVATFYNATVLEAFRAMPLAVMRADLCRCAQEAS